jgi:hypothetical protein
VNGQEVHVAQLHPGDELRVGLTRFVVQVRESAGAAVT